MARPSPSSSASRMGRSCHHCSPERSGYFSDFLADDRNSAISHRDALEAAQAEHDRVREAAIRAYELHGLEEERRRIELEQKKEQERLRVEASLLAEELRLRELRALSVPKLPPEPEPPREPTPRAVPPPPSPRKPAEANGHVPSPPPTAAPDAVVERATQTAQPSSLAAKPSHPALNPLAVAPNGQTPPRQVPGGLFSQQPNPLTLGGAGQGKQSILNPIAQAAPPAPKAVAAPPEDRYSQIHKELKKLRKDVVAQSKVGPLKGKLGEMRRSLRKSMGQLTDVRGANAQPLENILGILRESLGRLPSTPVDVALFVREPRNPVEGSALNTPQLPSLFIYMLSMLSKAIISQFVNECSAKPEMGDPIGVLTAQVFSQQDFQWRGASLIDILMAKFRVACPVLFGYRATDRTVAGRLALGWKPDVDERTHNNRMVGLGTGYASIALRDFSRSRNRNPFPPSRYWTALAFILNTPPQLISDTQLSVLKAMIDGHEQRFISFYGTAAIAALHVAIVEFPAKAPKKTPPSGALMVLGEVLRRDRGLNLL